MDNEMFENWGETKEALLEGLDPKMKEIVSPVLENQKNYATGGALNEAAAAGATQAHDIAGFRKIMVPMIRRIIPGTIATELVGVQPMQGPVGLIYSLRYLYGENVTANDNLDPGFGGNTNIAQGDEAFGNIEQANSTVIRQFYAGAVNGPLQGGSPVNDAVPGGSDQAAGASGIGPGVGSPQLVQEATATGGAWGSTQSALSGCTTGGSGSTIEGSGGRRMNLEVVSQAVEAGSRKLQAGWTIEAMQDLQAQHGLDIESEMTQALSAEIVQEIDAEIINDLLALAGTVQTFDGAGGGVYGGGGAGNYAPAYVGDRLANLGVLINYVANEIARRTRRGAANFIVVSPLIVSVLQSAAKSVFAPAVEGSFKGPNNTMLVGTLNGTIKVYSYIWNTAGSGIDLGGGAASPVNSTEDTILVGYKGGNGETDTGYFYAPYIPLMSSGVVVNPLTFQPVVSLMTRYGKTSFTNVNTSLGNSSDYYGKINVTSLNFA
jgi:hypothetical protein